MAEFDQYKDRKIVYEGVQSTKGWNIKIYTITTKEKFEARDTLGAVIEKLPDEIARAEKSKIPLHKQAFLVIHEAREGVWILLSWWTGGEMIKTVVRFASFTNPKLINPSPHSGALICVWELEVFLHERKAWINHVLKKAENPDFRSYLNDVLE